MIVLFLIGTFGNIHTILVYWRVVEMQERSHVRTIIIWLSAVDLTTCVVVMPFETILVRLWFSVSSNAVCKLIRYIAHTTVVSSCLILTVIGHERYRNIYSILLGTKSEERRVICKINRWLKGKSTHFRQNFICSFILIFCSVLFTPIFVFLGIETVPLNFPNIYGTQCITLKQYRSSLTAGLYSAVGGLLGLFCFMYCCFCYGKILYLIYKQYKKEKARRKTSIHLRAKVHKAQQSSNYKKRKPKYKVTISLLAVTLLSFCSLVLYSIGSAIIVSNSPLKDATITLLLMRACFINNACNPIIYFICDNKYRQACKKLYIK
ncbi:neuropeptide Y receptor type 6-like [Mytilus trossulus]|uniref:neuropeptide Y receptor type 6-like n=1 Tax=Mytilus trossulus TaxID=6551 RepID=UPI003003E01E